MSDFNVSDDPQIGSTAEQEDAAEEEDTAEQEDAVSCLVATPEEVEAGLKPMAGLSARGKLPRLFDEERRGMPGDLTPEQRELGAALVEVLDRREDLCTALGFGAAIFTEILDKDAELLRFGEAAQGTVRVLTTGQALLNALMGALNATVLLSVDERLVGLSAPEQGEEHDRLLQAFQPAFTLQEQIQAKDPKTPPAADVVGPRPHIVSALRQQLQEALRDGTVARAVDEVLRAPARALPPSRKPGSHRPGGGWRGKRGGRT